MTEPDAASLARLSMTGQAKRRKVDLYGGAMSAELPAELIDASDLRQVPDYQECFVHPVHKDQSLIIELLDINDDEEGVIPTKDAGVEEILKASIRRHFAALDDAQGPEDTVSVETASNQTFSLETPFTVPNGGEAIRQAAILQGTHRLQKFNEGTRKRVRVAMALVRLEAVGTELLITLFDADETAGEGGLTDDEADQQPTKKPTSPVREAEKAQAISRWDSVLAIMQSVRILEWTLFPEYAPDGYSKWA
ncbi:hypothetical protein BCR37DRAFT_394817 [Protomyces lactucae-debilis]|uniref:Uncharacterized protein n=1 Tax=Protomyces lactucae-debilis TaxID=2754530 RepID=A0A1Y2F453_PROLT|nr:uncharacterized protein BCR37DRAFT_394817 [Protomyces lactucae-debilis]ORY77725.1 hypothetical protein BCR37DRAFT_394817 [Protomyces lactucae-debilis]